MTTIEFEPVQRRHATAFSTRTHSQAFSANVDGREFWGECVRFRDADRKIAYDVELRSRDRLGRSYAVGERSHVALRARLLIDFQANVRAWAAAL